MTRHASTRARPAHLDRADIIPLEMAFGAKVELMRTSYRTHVFPKHSHEFFTIGVVIDGEGTMWCRGANHTTRPGDVVVIAPGEIHTGAPSAGAKVLSYLAVHVPADALAACAHSLRTETDIAFGSPVIHDEELAAQLRRLNSAMRTPDGEGNRAAADSADDALMAALDLLVRRHAEYRRVSEPSLPPGEPRVVHIARQVIEDCFGDNSQTSLRALAERSGVTPFHLVRVFRRAMGLSPHQYLLQTRVRRAAQLLASGVQPSFVAAMTGFADQSHLTTQFKRYVGITPSLYQRCLTNR